MLWGRCGARLHKPRSTAYCTPTEGWSLECLGCRPVQHVTVLDTQAIVTRCPALLGQLWWHQAIGSFQLRYSLTGPLSRVRPLTLCHCAARNRMYMCLWYRERYAGTRTKETRELQSKCGKIKKMGNLCEGHTGILYPYRFPVRLKLFQND